MGKISISWRWRKHGPEWRRHSSCYCLPQCGCVLSRAGGGRTVWLGLSHTQHTWSGGQTATLVRSLHCTLQSAPLKRWETARDSTRSHLSANPAIGSCRRNTFYKAFNVFKLMCLTANIKCIYIPFIKFYIEVFQFLAREPDVACRIIFLQLDT